jgi:hypothetical protein
MSFETALRCCEILLAAALVQRNLEHLSRKEFWPHLGLLAGGALLLFDLAPSVVLPLLFIGHILHLLRYNGPYNGGSDKMLVLVTTCLCLAHWLPGQGAQELALAYLAVQLILSYFVSGWIKVKNASWRSGQALREVFSHSIYPRSRRIQALHKRPKLVFWGAWTVMIFELVFPLSLFWQGTFIAALALAFSFHVANAVLFGLNRFVWAWISAYPALIWFQHRVLSL